MTSPGVSPGVSVSRSARGALALAGKAVEAAMRPAHCEEFIDRLFSIPELEAVELDRRRGVTRLRFERGASATGDQLRSLAAVMKNGRPVSHPVPELSRIEALARERPVRLWRVGKRLTFVEVTKRGPNRRGRAGPAIGLRRESNPGG